MNAIFQRELGSYFRGIQGYLCAAFILLFVGVYLFVLNLSQGYANFEYVMGNMSFVLIFVIPVLTMRVISEERKQKTDQLLYSLPMSMVKIVIGKYLAMLVVLLLPTVIICTYPLILSAFGAVSLRTSFCSILAFFLLGATLSSIGMFISSVTENQAIAAALSFVVILGIFFFSSISGSLPASAIFSYCVLAVLLLIFGVVLNMIIKNTTFSLVVTLVLECGLAVFYFFSSKSFASVIPNAMTALALFDRFNKFVYGVFDVTTIVFFLSIIGVFLFLTVQSLEKRRWN